MEFVIEPRVYDHPDVMRMVDEVQAEYVVRYGGPDQAVLEPLSFRPPAGLFLVGLLDGVPVAMGGWRRSAEAGPSSTVAEIKRMYVSAGARRLGLARQMLAALECSAAQAHVSRLILGTGAEQPEAIALYESSGYRPMRGFGYYADVPGALFYGKELPTTRERPASNERDGPE